MTPSQKLKSILKILGFTPTILFNAIGISAQAAKRILSENGKIYAYELINICDFLGIKYYIFKYCENKKIVPSKN